MKTNKIYSMLLSALLVLFCANHTPAQQGWYQVTSPQVGFDLYGLYFKDINTGLANSFKTTNGGQNWYNTPLAGGYAMMFPALNTGYLTGIDIFKTTNLGENWTQQANPSGAILYGVHFPNINTGYACGEGASIVKTTNGGTNWTLLSSPVSSSYYLMGIYFVDGLTGFVTGDETANNSSVILKTTNGGNNWSVQNFPAQTAYHAIFFVNSNTGIVIGSETAKTTNGGNSWVPKTFPGGLFLSLYFSSANIGCAVGYGGIIIKTTNTAETWFEQTSPSGSTLNTVYFINDNTGYICGNSGVVLKTTDGGGPPIGIQKIGNEIPESYVLCQNYPNPFNPETIINYELRSATGGTSYVSLKVFDVTGKFVHSLVEQTQSAGKYKVTFSGIGLPSGVYNYVLSVPGYLEAKKMVLVK